MPRWEEIRIEELERRRERRDDIQRYGSDEPAEPHTLAEWSDEELRQNIAEWEHSPYKLLRDSTDAMREELARKSPAT